MTSNITLLKSVSGVNKVQKYTQIHVQEIKYYPCIYLRMIYRCYNKHHDIKQGQK